MHLHRWPFAITFHSGKIDASTFGEHRKTVLNALTDRGTDARVETVEPDILNFPKMGRSFFRISESDAVFTWNFSYNAVPIPHFVLSLVNCSGDSFMWTQGLQLPVFERLLERQVDLIVGYDAPKSNLWAIRPYLTMFRGKTIRGKRSKIYLYGKTMLPSVSRIDTTSGTSNFPPDILPLMTTTEAICREHEDERLMSTRFDGKVITKICSEIDGWIASSNRADVFNEQLAKLGLRPTDWFCD